MFGKLLLLFSIIPIIELFLIIKIGSHIGALPTVVIILLTAVTGASLARYQGLQTLQRIRQSLNDRKIPANEVLDGFLILIAALLLLTPGLLTDVTGFLLLIPQSRTLVKFRLYHLIQNWFSRGKEISTTMRFH